MAVVNINVDASIVNAIDIADAAAAAGDILVQFFSDGLNVFNVASESLGGAAGDVGVTAGVKYTVAITPAQAHLLTGAALTYKLSKAAIVNGDRTMPLKDNGTVTVTNLDVEADVPINYINGNNVRTVTDAYAPLPNDDIIIVNANDAKIITLPDNTLMVGKRYTIKTINGDVNVNNHADAPVITLTVDLPANVEVVATATAWETFL